MQLLVKLLAVRKECLLLYRNKIYCSCGSSFEDSAVAENHCVQHERDESPEEISEVQEANILKSLQSLSTLLKLEAGKSLHRVHPPNEKTVFVLLDELEINGGAAKDVACSECSKVLSDYAELKGHFQKCHKESWRPVIDDFVVTSKQGLLEKDVKGSSTFYFCPLPGCKYHILQKADNKNPLKNFPSLKLLKQHYTKVHATRAFECEKCRQSFASQPILQRHVKVCGLEFSCDVCGVKYRSLEILQTHGRRKGHVVRNHEKETKKAKKSVGHIKIDTSFYHGLSGLHSTPVTLHGTSGLLRIAPRPSPMHLSAAIALSELGAEKKFLSKVDVGNQTDMELLTMAPKGVKRSSTTITTQTPSSSTLNGRKRSAETQTRSRRNRWKKSKTIPAPLSLVSTASSSTAIDTSFVLTEEQETQTPTLTSMAASSAASIGIYSGAEFPPSFSGWWSAASSSTQTSPRSSATDIFKDLLLSSNPENESGIAPSLLLPLRRPHPPRLGEIEQFNSTETQTEEGGGGRETQEQQQQQTWREVENDEDEFALNRLYMEAETQFDLDDILCSNYTQTGYSSDMLSSPSLLPVEQEGSSAMNSIETQTIHSIFDVRSSSADSGGGGGSSQSKDFATSHMETQTGDDFKIT